MNLFKHYPEHIQRLTDIYTRACEHFKLEGVVINAGTAIDRLFDDQGPAFRTNPHFNHWVPWADQPDAWLIIKPGDTPILWYSNTQGFWDNDPVTPDDAWGNHFDLHPYTDTKQVAEYLSQHAKTFAHVGPASDVEAFQPKTSNDEKLIQFLDFYRANKTAYEHECIAEANRFAARAHTAAYQAFTKDFNEWDIHCAYTAASEQDPRDLPYGNIVALDRHAAILHHIKMDTHPRKLGSDSRSLLIDAGRHVNGYAADVTRTYINDTAHLFAELVLDLNEQQQRMAENATAGTAYLDCHKQAHRMIGELLHRHNIVTCSGEDAFDLELTNVFFPHGLGHLLGIQVHDVGGDALNELGDTIEKDKRFPKLRTQRVLQAGDTLTVEPGIYFIDLLLEEARQNGLGQHINWDTVGTLHPFGGIRIEDNIAVSAEGPPRNFTREAFAELDR